LPSKQYPELQGQVRHQINYGSSLALTTEVTDKARQVAERHNKWWQMRFPEFKTVTGRATNTGRPMSDEKKILK